jgi:hypothetical protein
MTEQQLISEQRQSELRMGFNEALAGGSNMNGDGGPIIHTEGHAQDLEFATTRINELRHQIDGLQLTISEVQVNHYEEWHEEDGDVLWWKWPVEDAPWVGTPNDLGYTVEIATQLATSQRNKEPVELTPQRVLVGGWPFDEHDLLHLFWTRLPGINTINSKVLE